MSCSKFLPLHLVMLGILTGCTSTQVQRQAATVNEAVERNSKALTAAVKDNDVARLAAQEVNQPYLAGNSIPLSRDAGMPAHFREILVTAKFARGPVPLETALRQVTEASGVLVTATSDALLPASMFLPRGSNSSSAAAPAPTSGPQAIPLMPVGSPMPLPMNSAGASAGTQVTLRAENLLLWKLLDDIGRQSGLSWRPVASGAEFYRLDTQTFDLPAIPQTMASTASLGRNGSSSAAFDTANKTTFLLKEQDLVRGIITTVDALLTTGGKAVVSAESQTLIVTDTPAALARVARYMAAQNRVMSRRVRVVVDAYEVTSRNNNDLGFNWDAVYTSLNNSLRLQSPAALAGSQAGSLVGSRTNGSMAGSSIVINALNEVGTVVNQRSFPFTVVSGRPYTVAMRKTFDYVNQVQLPAQSTTASVVTTVTTPPSVQQKEETVGTFLTVIPTAKADGTIFLSLSIDVTSNRPLVPFSVGSGAAGVTVQQKTIDGTGFIMESATRSNVPLVMGGIEFETGTTTERRMAPGAPLLLGGSNQDEHQKSRTVLVVTAVSEEGV